PTADALPSWSACAPCRRGSPAAGRPAPDTPARSRSPPGPRPPACRTAAAADSPAGARTPPDPRRRRATPSGWRLRTATAEVPNRQSSAGRSGTARLECPAAEARGWDKTSSREQIRYRAPARERAPTARNAWPARRCHRYMSAPRHSFDAPPATEGMGQRAAVDIFQLAAQRHAVGDTADSHARCPHLLGDVKRGGFALDGGVGGQDDLAHLMGMHALHQTIDANLGRADAIDGRQMPHQHEIETAVAAGLLQRHHIRRRLDDAYGLPIATRIGANAADIQLGQGMAVLAVADLGNRRLQRLREAFAALAIALKDLESHALRGFRADARQYAQGIDQLVDQGAEFFRHACYRRPRTAS